MFKEIAQFIVKHKISSALGIAAAVTVGLGKLAFLAEDEIDAEKKETETELAVANTQEAIVVSENGDKTTEHA